MHRQAGDCTEKVLGGNIGADFAGGSRSLQQSPQSRFQPLVKVGGQRVEGRVSRVQRAGKAAFGRDETHETLHPSRQCLERLILGRQGPAASAQASISRWKTATIRSDRCGKWRYTVPTPTPAFSAISRTGASTPEVANTAMRGLQHASDVAQRVGPPTPFVRLTELHAVTLLFASSLT